MLLSLGAAFFALLRVFRAAVFEGEDAPAAFRGLPRPFAAVGGAVGSSILSNARFKIDDLMLVGMSFSKVLS